MKKNIGKLIFITSLFSLFFTVSSCNVGLGEKVDAEAPKISVNYPPEASVIRGDFIVCGDYSDDKGIETIYVNVRYNGSDTVLQTVTADFKKNSWSVNLNKNLELLDGKYTVEAYALDGAGHSTKAMLSFDIDNTAPCLLISKPLAVGNETPTEYGQAVKIAGNISEEHKTSSLIVHLQEAAKNPATGFLELVEGTQKDISVTDFSTMDADNPLIIAKYYTQKQIDDETEESVKAYYTSLRDRYLEIYGSDFTKGDKNFYANIQLMDNAKEYKNPEDDGVGPGNISSVYYINSSEFNEAFKDDNGDGLTATAIRKLLNGTSSYSETERNEILSKLGAYSISSNKADLSNSCSVFLVNPDNNPYYTINECAVEGSYPEKTPNTALAVNLKAGKDSISIDPSQVSVTVYKMDNETDTNTSNKSEAAENAWVMVPVGSEAKQETTDCNITISIKNTEATRTYTDTFFSAGEFYQILVDGKDVDGNTLVPYNSYVYGFKVKSTASIPVITLVTQNDEYISGKDLNETGRVVELKVTTAGNTAIPTVTIIKNAESAASHFTVYTDSSASKKGVAVTNISTNAKTELPEVKDIVIETPSVENGNLVYPVKLTIGGGNKSYIPSENNIEILGRFKYTFSLVVSDSVGNVSPATYISFYVNNVNPKIQNLKLTPVEENNKVNGTITFSANATTNHELESVEYKVYVGTDTTPVATGITNSVKSEFGTLTESKATFDTASKTEYDGKALKIEIIAKDKVGNEITDTIEGYTIDQSSDLPKLVPNSFKELEKDSVSSANGNVFDKNSKLIGSFSDTDGVAEASYVIKSENGTKISEGTIENPDSSLFNISVPKTAGFYKLSLTAKDSTWSSGTSETKKYREITKNIWFAVDNANPDFTLTKIDGSEENLSSTQYKSESNVVYEGTVKDDWKIEGIKVYINDVLQENVTTEITTPSPANSDGSDNWKCTLNFEGKAEGSYNLKFKALDKAGKSKEISSTIFRDKTAPVFGTEGTKKLHITTADTDGWYNGSSLDIEGFVSDVSSPVKSVEYTIDGGTTYNSLNIEYALVNGVENRKEVTYKGTVVGVAKGNTITVRATDAAGNSKTTSLEGFKIDRESPELGLTHTANITSGAAITDGAYNAYSEVIYVNNVKDLYLKGNVRDLPAVVSEASGIDSIYLKLKSAPTAAQHDDVTVTVENGVWTAKYTAAQLETIFGSDSTSGTLYVLVTDKAGNKTSLALSTVIYDITYPSAVITKAKYKGTENSLTTANKIVTFEGTASDNQAITDVYLEYSLDGTSWTKYKTSAGASNNWSIDVNTEDSVFTDEETYYFRAVAVDAVGNTGNSGSSAKAFDDDKTKTGKILQSSDIPVITFSNITFTDGMSSSNPSWLLNTNDLFISVTDDDGVSKIEYTTDGTNWNEVTNGKITLGDASYTINFRVTDVYSTETPFTNCVLKDENGTTASISGVIYLGVDKTPPAVSNVNYYLYNGTKYPDTGVTTTSSLKFGGFMNQLKVECKASDKNGISKVEVFQGEKKWSGSCSDADYADEKEHTWSVEIKDKTGDSYLKNLASGTYEFILRVTDKSGSTHEKTFSLNIDNTPATIAVTSHNQDDLVGTDFTLKGTVDNSDTATEIKYCIDGNAADVTDWNNKSLSPYTGTIASWKIIVDDATASDEETHTESIKKLFMKVYEKDAGGNTVLKYNAENKIVYASGTNENKLYTTVQPVYFHFITKDAVGNTHSVTRRLRVDPQGDLPSVRMTYPVAANAAANSVTLSGPVRAQGEASTVGNNTITGIYMQIDPAYTSTAKFREALWTKTASNNPLNTVLSPGLKDDNSNFVKLSDIYKSSNVTLFENIYARYNAQSGLAEGDKKTETATAYNEYGIYVGNKTSWNFTINNSGELNGLAASDGTVPTNTVAVRLIVVDSKGNVTKTEPLIITLDADAPVFGSQPFYVYQFGWINKTTKAVRYTNTGSPAAGAKMYTDAGCRTVSSETFNESNYTKNFASEVYSDDMSLKGEWWLSGSVDDDSDIYRIVNESNSNYQIVLKDNAEEDGSFSADADDVPRSTVERYKSEAGNPGFIFNLRVGSKVNGEFGKLTYSIKAYQYSTEENNRKPSTKVFTINYDNKAPEIETSGNYYNINTKVANSYGVYTLGTAVNENGANGYTQSGFARTVFYFVKGTNVYDSSIKSGETGNVVATNAAGVTSNSNIYWKSSTVTAVSGSTITITASDVNIHTGSLVSLGGAYYSVTSVSGTDITLNKTPDVSLKDSPVYFAIGHVIDEDDEGVSKGVSRAIWSGSINSNNLPDGPAELHYVVFDAAGNAAHEKVDVLVGNNAPRLASVRVWSDFNGNGTEDETDETKYYYYAERTRKINGVNYQKASSVTSNVVAGTKATPFMTVKDKITFVPEIVGGNGDLYYSYRIGDGSEVKNTTAFGKGHNDGNYDDAVTGSYLKLDQNSEKYVVGHTRTNDAAADTEYKFEISADSIKNLENANNFKFTIWDEGSSDDGSVLWNASKCLTASMDFVLNVKYKDSTKPKVNVKPFYYNSATDNSIYKTDTYKDYRDFKGHIELENDIKGVTAITGKTVKTAVKTTDTALGEDPKVSGIITIRGTAYDDIRLNELKVQFLSHSEIGSAAVSAATYSAGVWTSESVDTADNMKNNGWTFTAKDVYNRESGHLVEWECNIDTSFVANLAELDRVFTITAVDERGDSGNRLSSDTTASASSISEDTVESFNRATYQMDVVPYIVRIHNSLSSVEADNPSVYDRTALGHYTTYDGETAKLVGFNFALNNADTDLSISSSTMSLYEQTVNGIPTLNNINKDVAYNQRHNGVNNDKLTDDVYIDVWSINGTAVVPGDNQALNMNMMINQQTKLIGFGFNNGILSWAMPNGKSSYKNYNTAKDFMRCSSFTYDAAGNSYGATLPGDEGNDYRFFSSRWGKDKYMSIGRISPKSGGYQDKERYQGASYASNVNESKTTNLYMAVFDQVFGYIEFKYGVIQGTNVTTNGTFNNTTESESTDNSLILANSTGSGTGILGKASEYISLGVTSNNTVIMIWYDGSKLMYAYREFTYDSKKETLAPKSDSSWTVVSNLMTVGGKYCKLAVDNQNGVHIAAYDTEGLNLNYIYIPGTSSTSLTDAKVTEKTAGIKTAVVDSYNSVGQQLTIDVAQISKTSGETTVTYQIPYISYLGTYPKRPRYAYLADPAAFYGSTSGKDGATDDKYTQIWECSVVPSPNKLFVDDYSPQRMCVGVWKTTAATGNGSGVLANSAPADSSKDSDAIQVFGNGTSNGVVAYLREASNPALNYGETAQLLNSN